MKGENMRLIDADELKAKISRSTCNYPELMWKKVTCDVINNQPTAYDIDKVVEQIKNNSFTHSSVNWMFVDDLVRTEEAIDIIRNGGKE